MNIVAKYGWTTQPQMLLTVKLIGVVFGYCGWIGGNEIYWNCLWILRVFKSNWTLDFGSPNQIGLGLMWETQIGLGSWWASIVVWTVNLDIIIFFFSFSFFLPVPSSLSLCSLQLFLFVPLLLFSFCFIFIFFFCQQERESLEQPWKLGVDRRLGRRGWEEQRRRECTNMGSADWVRRGGGGIGVWAWEATAVGRDEELEGCPNEIRAEGFVEDDGAEDDWA